MEDSNDLICICKAYDATEAELIRMQLEAEDIPCFLKSDNAGGVLPNLTLTTGIGIMVRQEDEIQAEQIIDDWLVKHNEL